MTRDSSCLAWRVALLLLLGGFSATGFAASPKFDAIEPVAAQRGKELSLTLHGDRLKDTQSFLAVKPGIEVLGVESAEDRKAVLKVRIAPDAPLGEHPLRVRTATGISEVRAFTVTDLPVAVEDSKGNSDFSKPQPIEMNSCVLGTIKNEDVDYFVVQAKKGQRLTAEIQGMRLGGALFDPYLAILDAKRFELAACDDSSLLLQDPFVSVIVPEDGAYVIQVRESSYGGSDNSRYLLSVGTFPRPTAVYPAGGRPGQKIDVTFLGDPKGSFTQSIQLPDKEDENYTILPEHEGQHAPSPLRFRVTDLPQVLEQESNHDIEHANRAPAEGPVAFNGIIQEKFDHDFYTFTARKGHRYNLRAHARSLRSPLDPVIDVFFKGQRRAGNDDQNGLDSQLRFDVPEDGDYTVQVRDHLFAGGPTYVYRLEITPFSPDLSLHIAEFGNNADTQQRLWVHVPRGNRFATWLRAERANFGSEVKFRLENLPQGVNVAGSVIPPNTDRIPIVFEAAADAPLDGRGAAVLGEGSADNKPVLGDYRQAIDLVFGEPNNTPYYRTAVDRMAVSVGEELPFTIAAVEPKAPLVRNGSMNIKVVATRKEGFTKPITLRMLWNPPGVGSAGEVTIPEGQNEAYYPLNANGDAPTQTWQLAILATADAGYGTSWCSTPLFPLRIESPYIAGQIEMTATVRGQPTPLLLKLDQLRPFEGTAKVRLLGLPPKVSAEAEELTVTKDDKELLFKLKTAEDAPVGQHKSLFCQVIVTEQGEPVAHSVAGGGVLRIDNPPPAPKQDKPAAPQPQNQPQPQQAQKPEAPPKPLSRLEQLRQQARKQE